MQTKALYHFQLIIACHQLSAREECDGIVPTDSRRDSWWWSLSFQAKRCIWLHEGQKSPIVSGLVVSEINFNWQTDSERRISTEFHVFSRSTCVNVRAWIAGPVACEWMTCSCTRLQVEQAAWDSCWIVDFSKLICNSEWISEFLSPLWVTKNSIICIIQLYLVCAISHGHYLNL